MTPTFIFSPDGQAAGTPEPTKPPRVRGPFDKETMAALDEAEDVAKNAQKAPFAAILEQKYKILPASVAALELKIDECEKLFGSARTADLGSQTHTVGKDEAKENIIEAIDEFRTGARMDFSTQAELEAFGVAVDLERNASVLAQLAQTILDDPRSPNLTGIGPDEISALQSALDDWKASGGDQQSDAAKGEGDRALAEQMFKEIEFQTRKIKIAMDGKYSYKKPESVEARRLFHLPLKRPFAPKMGL